MLHKNKNGLLALAQFKLQRKGRFRHGFSPPVPLTEDMPNGFFRLPPAHSTFSYAHLFPYQFLVCECSDSKNSAIFSSLSPKLSNWNSVDHEQLLPNKCQALCGALHIHYLVESHL